MADVNKSVLFTVGSVGTQAAGAKFGAMTAKLTAAAAAVGLLAVGIKKLVDDAQQFGQAFAAVSTDMSAFNKNTAGLINTLDGLQGTVKLQEAGLSLTAKQLSAIGVAATSMSQKLGEGPEGATARFNKLTKAIIAGSDRALLPYGIELEETEDKAVAQAEAIEKLTEKFGELSVEVQTAKEAQFAFKNSFDTVVQAEMNQFLETLADDWRDIGAEIWGGADAMFQLEKEIVATNGAILEFDQSMDGMIGKFNSGLGSLATSLMEFSKPLYEVVNGVLLLQSFGQTSLRDIQIAGLEADLDRLTQIEQLTKKADADRAKRQAEIQGLPQVMEFSESEAGITGTTGGRRRRREPKKEEAEAIVRQQFGPSEATNFRTGDRATEAGAEASQIAAKLAFENQMAADQAAMEAKIANDKLKQDQERNHLAVMLGLNKEAIDQQMRWQQMTADQRVKVLETTTSESTQILSNFAKSANAETKAGFEAQKALMYSANILSTIQGAAGAFARVMATIPPPASFIIAPIAAASVVASGAAAGKQIRSAKFGGDAKTKAPSTPNFSGGSLGASSGGGGDSFTFNVNVEGQTVFSSVMNANDIANQNGQRSFSTGQ
jgi:hypothetical protein